MSVREDRVQVTVMVDGKQGLNELGKLEMESRDLKKSMAGVKEETDEYIKKAKELSKVESQYKKLAAEVKRLADQEPYNIEGHQKAVKALRDVEQKYTQLGSEIKNVKRFNDDFINGQARQKEVSARIGELRNQMGLTGMTMGQLRKYQAELNRELDHGTTAGTARYEQLRNSVQQVNAVIARQRADVQGVGTAWGGLKSQLSEFGPMALAGAAISTITQAASASFSKNLKLGDELADISKNTGHTKDQVKALNDELARVDTVTDMEGLRNIAKVGGQLNVPKEDVKDFTIAVDKLNVALGDEFDSPEAITKDMGALRNIFSDIKSDKIDQDVLRIGNAINELGADGLATGPVVADFASRIGGVGITMGLTSGQVLGLSATLQELNVSTERGSTATVAILQKMAKAPADFAKVAGMGTKEFKNLVNTDIYGAFVKVVEGANKSKAASTAFAAMLDKLKIDGAGASEVVAKLGSNTALLQQKVDLSNTSLQSTNSILAEFANKNETAGAKWEKFWKRVSNVFVNSIVLTGLEGVMDVLDSIFNVTPEVEKLTTAWQNQADQVSNLEKNTLPLIDRYDQLKSKSTLTKDEQVELDKIIAQVAQTIPTAITQFDKYGKAMDISSDKAREFIETERSLLKVQNRDAIQARTEELQNIDTHIASVQKALNRRDADGNLVKSMQVYTSYGAVLQRTVKLTGEEINKLQSRLAGLQSDRKGTQEWIDRMNGTKLELPKSAEKPKVDAPDLPEEMSDEERKKAEKERERQLKDKATFLAKMAALDIEAEADEILRAIKKAEEKRRVDIEEANKLHISKKERQELLKQIDKTFMAEVVKIEEEGEKKKQEIAKKAAEEALKLAEETAKKRAQIAIAYSQLDLQKAKKTKDPEAIHEAEKNLLYVAYKQQALEKWREIEAIDDATATEAEKVRKQALLEELYLMEDQYHQNLSALEDTYRDNKAAKDRETAEKVIQYMQQGFQFLSDFKGIAIEKEIRKENAAKNQRIKNMDTELKEGRVTQEEYAKAKATIEANSDAKTKALKQKAAQSEKNWNIASSIMAGVLAVIKAAPNIPLQIATGVMAAAATAKIAATPLPEFYEGGTTGEPVNISAGGKFGSKPYVATVNEKGAEYIVPNWMLQNPMVADTVQMLEAIRIKGFAAGGSVATNGTDAPTFSTPSSTLPGANAETDYRLILAVERLNSLLENGIPAIFDYQEFEKETNRIKDIQTRSGARK